MPTSPLSSLIELVCRAVPPLLGDAELLGRFVERRDETALAVLVKRHGRWSTAFNMTAKGSARETGNLHFKRSATPFPDMSYGRANCTEFLANNLENQ
jgi:hypothetical protein